MISKFLRPCGRLLSARTPEHQVIRSGQMIPASQYDMKIPRKLHLSYALRVYWELIPVVFVTTLALSFMFFSIAAACARRVDVVFSSHNRKNISRTMNLRHPTVQKLIIINQRYEPWPEMQDVLDKMKEQERKLKIKMDMCAAKAKSA